MPVTVYRSSDASAPVLNGTAGSLVAVLDGCLCSGYGSQTGAGWTKPYTGTNGAVFRPGAGLQYFLNVNDNGPGAGTGKEARVVGYETMTAYATGTNLFPTAAQMANGVFVRKSTAADSTARPWIVIGDARTFYMWALTGDAANTYLGWGFGEIYSFKTNDQGRMFLHARDTENSATSSVDTFGTTATYINTQNGLYLARDTAGGVGAIAVGKVGDFTVTGGSRLLNGTLSYKNPADNHIYLFPFRVGQTAGGTQFRGRFRGLWQFCHPASNAADGDTITGTGDLAGKTFLIIKQAHIAADVFTVETSDTWETN